MKKITDFNCFTCLIVWIFLLFIISQFMATTYCVANETDLIAALNDAKDKGFDDVIIIQQGAYNGNFVYSIPEAFGIRMEGGHISGCNSRVIDATNTILDAQNCGTVLVFSAPNASADFGVDGLSITSGSSGMNSGKINCTYTQNPGSQRTGIIRVEATTGQLQDIHVIPADLSSTTIIECLEGGSCGDHIRRGFYVPNYQGIDVQSVTLSFCTRVEGNYTLKLTIHENAYDGQIIGSSTASFFLPADLPSKTFVTFNFSESNTTPGNTLTFIMEKVSGPDGSIYFGVGGWGEGCLEVVETEGTNPPLDTFRSYGVAIIINGNPNPIVFDRPKAMPWTPLLLLDE